MHAGIGSSVDELRGLYGQEVEIDTYRPDLYAPSYVFQKDGAEISATILSGRAVKIDVFFAKCPPQEVGVLLEQYSGDRGWRSVETSDPGFERQFPAFDPKRANYFVVTGLAAMVQEEVGLGELVLWIQQDSYPDLLQDYRGQQNG